MIPNVSLTGLKPGDAADPKAIAAKVQGMFMEEMLKAMEESIDAEDGLFGGSASSDIYRGMLREQLSAAISGNLNSPLETEMSKALQKRSSTPDPEPASEARLFVRCVKRYSTNKMLKRAGPRTSGSRPISNARNIYLSCVHLLPVCLSLQPF